MKKLVSKHWNTAKSYGVGRIGVNPEDARNKGRFVSNGLEYERQKPLKNVLKGKDTRVSFSLDVSVRGYYALVSVDDLQPSHLGNIENPLHFIPEAQPRNRATSESGAKTPVKIAENLRPAEICEGANAYTGAPVINTRGEVIQGNGRAYTMRYYYENFANDPRGYQDYLLENRIVFGLSFHSKNVISRTISHPVLVRVIEVSDVDAIKLGQYKQADLEASANRADGIKARLNLMNDEDLSRVLENVFAQTKKDDSLSDIIRNSNLITQLVRLGGIRGDELEEFVRNGQINERGIDVVKRTLVNLIFKGQDTNLPNIFEDLPMSLQTAITKATPYILRVPEAKSIKKDVAESVFIFRDYARSKKNFKSVKSWAEQGSFFDKKPVEIYSRFSLILANIYDRAATQREIVEYFQKFQMAVSDQPATMFESARKGISKEQAVQIVFEGKKVVAITTDTNRELALKIAIAKAKIKIVLL